ncbi:Uncharacterised protein [uncultured archaeon]|nr:Uncharacterised protein [uncultured archaeon]
MYFLYLDESGNPNISKIWFPESDIFVLAGAIVHESAYKEIEEGFRLFKISNLPIEVREKPIHAVDLNNTLAKNKCIYKNFMTYDQGQAILEATYAFLSKQKMEIIGVIIDNVEYREKYSKPDNPYELSYRFVLEQFQQTIDKNNHCELGQVNLAQSQQVLKKRITSLHKTATQNGTGYMKLPNIIKTVNINPINDSCFYEIADLVCYAYQREYSNWIRLQIGKKIYDKKSYLSIIANLSKMTNEKQSNGSTAMKIFPRKREL